MSNEATEICEYRDCQIYMKCLKSAFNIQGVASQDG